MDPNTGRVIEALVIAVIVLFLALTIRSAFRR
jgi:hypothetical protein